jgi:hypothetical protein
MEALNIAFDTIIVGVLALPWLVLIDALFYSGRMVGWFTQAEAEQPAKDEAPQSAKDKASRFALMDPIVASVVSVLLIAVAYFIGSAVSRIAQDFFSDDHLPLVTDDSIRTRVYCDASLRKSGDSPLGEQKWSVVADHVFDLDGHNDRADLLSSCPSPIREGKWTLAKQLHLQLSEPEAQLQWFVQQIFYLQEDALLQGGEDKTNRIRQLHQQTMVLRGAAFDGLVAFALCAFGLCATTYPRILALIPVGILLSGLYLLASHLESGSFTEPPYAEITLVVLSAAGCVAIWRGVTGYLKSPHQYKLLFWPLLLLTPMAYFAWWWTEVLYDQLILYSYVAVMPHN